MARVEVCRKRFLLTTLSIVTCYTDFMTIVGHMLQIELLLLFHEKFHSVDQKEASRVHNPICGHMKRYVQSLKDIDLYNTS